MDGRGIYRDWKLGLPQPKPVFGHYDPPGICNMPESGKLLSPDTSLIEKFARMADPVDPAQKLIVPRDQWYTMESFAPVFEPVPENKYDAMRWKYDVMYGVKVVRPEAVLLNYTAPEITGIAESVRKFLEQVIRSIVGATVPGEFYDSITNAVLSSLEHKPETGARRYWKGRVKFILQRIRRMHSHESRRRR